MTLKRLLSQKRASGNTFIGVTALPVLPPAFIFYLWLKSANFWLFIFVYSPKAPIQQSYQKIRNQIRKLTILAFL